MSTVSQSWYFEGSIIHEKISIAKGSQPNNGSSKLQSSVASSAENKGVLDWFDIWLNVILQETHFTKWKTYHVKCQVSIFRYLPITPPIKILRICWDFEHSKNKPSYTKCHLRILERSQNSDTNLDMTWKSCKVELLDFVCPHFYFESVN